jgi:hypothetical protein
MSSVWKRLQRYNKRAAKFKFTVAYHDVDVESDPHVKSLPKNLRIIWTRRGRRLASSVQSWEPSLGNPFKGTATWPTTEIQEITVTLFRDPHTDLYDDKSWTMCVEEASSESAKKRPLALAEVNLNKFVTGAMCQTEELIVLKPQTKRVKSCSVTLTVSCLFLKEGQATDDDMMSLASMMSTVPSDIARLEDVLDEDESSATPVSGAPSDNVTSITERMNKLVNDLHSERAVDVEEDNYYFPGDGHRDAAEDHREESGRRSG